MMSGAMAPRAETGECGVRVARRMRDLEAFGQAPRGARGSAGRSRRRARPGAAQSTGTETGRGAARDRGAAQPMGTETGRGARRAAAAMTPMNSTRPNRQNTASVTSMPPEPQRDCALPSMIVMYQIGMFDSDANRLYLVAAAPSPMASSTNAENPA